METFKVSNLLVDDLGKVKLSDFGFIKSIYSEFKQPTYEINWDIIPVDIENSIVNQFKESPDKKYFKEISLKNLFE